MQAFLSLRMTHCIPLTIERIARYASALITVLLVLMSQAAGAHEPFEITTTARVLTDRIELRLLIADSTAVKLCVAKSKTQLKPESFEPLRPSLEKCAEQLFLLRDGEQELKPRSATVSLSPENDLEVMLTYPPPATGNVSFDAVHLKQLVDPIYGDTFTATSDKTFLVQKLLTTEEPSIVVSLNASSAAPATRSSFYEFLRLGIEHILTGYDHLLFLAGLLIVCQRLRSALIIITSFTLAHSITLALAGLNLVTVPATIIEPSIAATIVFVGAENLWRSRIHSEPKYRWLLTFVFGLLHGFGFAGALRESGLPSDGAALVMPLLGFNLGVELGQIAVAAIFLPLLFQLRKKAILTRYGVIVLSILVCIAGTYWLLDRTVL